jgi:Mrp family chromosome partitioning ATPase
MEVPEKCPGTATEMAGKAEACAGCPNQNICASGGTRKPDPSLPLINMNLEGVKHRILILSGKGGVGKSTLCASLAQTLQSLDMSICVLDVDLCGPSQARIMGCPEGSRLHSSAAGLSPVYTDMGVAVVSIAFLLDSDDTAVIWRGDKKTGMIRQFLRDVDFGELDVLLVDTPPGTSDEHLALATMFKPCSAILVTTPQEIAWQDVRKEIDFCRRVDIPIIGIVENMAGGIKCASCGFVDSDLFVPAGVQQYAEMHNIPYLGRIPIDQSIAIACDQGLPVRQCFSNGTLDSLDVIGNRLVEYIRDK